MKVHWGLADPSRMQGSEEEVAAAFRHTIALLRSRIERLAAADVDTLEKVALQSLLVQLGND